MSKAEIVNHTCCLDAFLHAMDLAQIVTDDSGVFVARGSHGFPSGRGNSQP